MPYRIRRLAGRDAECLLSYAEAHMPHLGFVAGNIAAFGLEDRGQAYQGAYVGAFDEAGEPAGLVACYNMGSFVIYAPDELAARRLSEEAVAARGRPSSVLGEERSVRVMLGVLAEKGWAPAEVTPHLSQELTPERFVQAPGEGVRPADRRDIPALAALRAAYHVEVSGRAPDLAAELADLESRFDRMLPYVAEAEGHIVGMCSVQARTPHAAQVGETYVGPHQRGRGIAKALLSALCARIMPGRDRITLIVRPDNEPAIRCYRRLGFRNVSEYLIVRMEE